MGYFRRLQKRARNESGWSAYSYTGSRAAGADLVSEDTWCVVYGTDVVYESESEYISSLSLSTNFVNPLSSGNPSVVLCYLYDFDPTQNGSAAAAAPPPGYVAAVSDSFTADTAGRFRTFSFPGLSLRSERVWLWFCSTVSYEQFGSNSIYHYATGNWSASLGTGTKTPVLYGSFAGGGTGGGSGEGGDSGGGEYSVISSGTYNGIYAQRDISLSRNRLTASRTTLSFAGGGQATFSCVHGGGGDAYLRLRGYLTDSAGFDSGSGVPTGTVLASSGSASDGYSFSATVTADKSYYLWTVIDYCSDQPVPVVLTVSPGGWSYTVADMGERELGRWEETLSMSMGAFETGRMALSFDYSGQIRLSVLPDEEAFSGMLYISDQPDIDSASGIPLHVQSSLRLGSETAVTVEKGKVYYFFAVYNGGSEAGSLYFSLLPPEPVWELGDSAAYYMLDDTVGCGFYLGEQQYFMAELSFAHTGMAELTAQSPYGGFEQAVTVYLCEKDCFDESTGRPTRALYSRSGLPSLSLRAQVVAGKDYWLFFRNSAEESPVSAEIYITAPEESPAFTKIYERGYTVTRDISYNTALRSFTYTLNDLYYIYRGKSTVTVEKRAGQEDTALSFAVYLCADEGIDADSGVPTGEILAWAEASEDDDSVSLEFQAQERRYYHLYIVTPEVYGSMEAQLTVKVECPPPRYFSVTETGEAYALKEPWAYSAAPGESGVLRLELSFGCSGRARVEAVATGGTRWLMGWAALTPWLDGYQGAPVSDTLAHCAGSAAAPDLSFEFPVRQNSSIYLFVRGEGRYDAAEFDVSISCESGAVNIFHQGKTVKACPLVFSEGQWRNAEALCRSSEKWHSGA